MICFWYRSNGDSDLNHNVLSVVARFSSPCFNLWLHCIMLGLLWHMYLYFIMRRSDTAILVFLLHIMRHVSWLLRWCVLRELILAVCSCVIGLIWGLSPSSLLRCLHDHFLQISTYPGVYIISICITANLAHSHITNRCCSNIFKCYENYILNRYAKQTGRCQALCYGINSHITYRC